MKHYFGLFISISLVLVFAGTVPPWLISQPDNLAVTLGVLALGLCPVFGWMYGTYMFNVFYNWRKK